MKFGIPEASRKRSSFAKDDLRRSSKRVATHRASDRLRLRARSTAPRCPRVSEPHLSRTLRCRLSQQHAFSTEHDSVSALHSDLYSFNPIMCVLRALHCTLQFELPSRLGPGSLGPSVLQGPCDPKTQSCRATGRYFASSPGLGRTHPPAAQFACIAALVAPAPQIERIRPSETC